MLFRSENINVGEDIEEAEDINVRTEYRNRISHAGAHCSRYGIFLISEKITVNYFEKITVR